MFVSKRLETNFFFFIKFVQLSNRKIRNFSSYEKFKNKTGLGKIELSKTNQFFHVTNNTSANLLSDSNLLIYNKKRKVDIWKIFFLNIPQEVLKISPNSDYNFSVIKHKNFHQVPHAGFLVKNFKNIKNFFTNLFIFDGQFLIFTTPVFKLEAESLN